MNKINRIEITDLLAFYGLHTIDVKGESLLVYGENGSGKSSLYKALKLFFNASSAPNQLVPNRNRWAIGPNRSPKIEVSFEGKENPINFEQAKNLPWIADINLASGFLSYKEILRTHFDIGKKHNYFEFVIEHILRGYKLASGTILSREWAEIREASKEFLLKEDVEWEALASEMQGEENTTADQLRSTEIGSINTRISEFNQTLENFLSDINTKIKNLILEFDHRLAIELVVEQLSDREEFLLFEDDDGTIKRIGGYFDYREGSDNILEETLLEPFITTQLSLFGQNFSEYQEYLNEARLSALAICIFLGAALIKPTTDEQSKILFLDDILIGLDTGNRLPLLKILKKHFANYQVFLTTYDKYWFEIAKNHLEYKQIEMYFTPVHMLRNPATSQLEELLPGISPPENTVDQDKRYFEKPLIFRAEGKEPLAKAKEYFLNCDYPAAGNALRKECERFLKHYLPNTRRIAKDGSEVDTLEKLLIQLELFFDDCDLSLDTDLVDQIRYFRRAVLNPASHDDIRHSLYRREIEEMFSLVEKLKKLPGIVREIVLKPDQELTYSNPASKYVAKLRVADVIYKVTTNNGQSKLSAGKFCLDHWSWNGVDYAVNANGKEMPQADIKKLRETPNKKEFVVTGICKSLGIDTFDFETEVKTGNKALKDL